jgi:hypothetical protein
VSVSISALGGSCAKGLLTTRCLRNGSTLLTILSDAEGLAHRAQTCLGIQQPTDALVVCKRALAETDKLAQNNDEFPDLYGCCYYYHSSWGWRGFDFCQGY